MFGTLPALLLILSSITFMVVSLVVFYKYIGAHRLPSGQYYLLLGFIHLKWIVWAYVVLTLGLSAWTLVAIFG